MNTFLSKSGIKTPYGILDIRYNSKIFPNGENHDFIKNGANCQVFAYEILRYNGKIVPDLRSSEMWEDTKYSSEVQDFQVLDLVFFNKSNNSYGAHVGLYIGNNQIIHCTNKTRKVEIWNLDYFTTFEDYKIILGGKRYH